MADYTRAVAIVCLTILESVALATGQDGVFFLPVAGLIGYVAGVKTEKIATLLGPISRKKK